MTIHLKIRSMDFGAPLGGDIDVPADATVEQAVNAYLDTLGKSLTPELLRQSVILVNNRAARAEQVLQPEDAVMVLKSIEGG